MSSFVTIGTDNLSIIPAVDIAGLLRFVASFYLRSNRLDFLTQYRLAFEAVNDAAVISQLIAP